MANEYFDAPDDLAPATRARSVDINVLKQAVDSAFDKLPAEDHLKRQTANFAETTADVANAYQIALAYPPLAYVDGMLVTARFHAANTGNDGATLDVNGLGSKAVKRFDGTNPGAGDLQGIMELRYNAATGTFQISPNALAAANAAAVSATTAGHHAQTATQGAQTATQHSGIATSAAARAEQAATAAAAITNLPKLTGPAIGGLHLAANKEGTAFILAPASFTELNNYFDLDI